MSYTTDVLEGMAADVNAAGLGVYRGPDGEFTREENVRGIFFSRLPEYPDEALAITRWGDDPGELAINDVLVQIRFRVRNPLDGEALADDLRDLFHNRVAVQYGSARFNRIKQESFGPLGTDDNGRFEYSLNFVLTGNRYGTQSP